MMLSKIKTGTFNVRGLNEDNKKRCLWEDLSKYKVDICCLQETRIKHKGLFDSTNIEHRSVFQFDRSVVMLKIINRICPESLHDKFGERSSINKYDTRNKTDLQIPRLNLRLQQKKFQLYWSKNLEFYSNTRKRVWHTQPV